MTKWMKIRGTNWFKRRIFILKLQRARIWVVLTLKNRLKWSKSYSRLLQPSQKKTRNDFNLTSNSFFCHNKRLLSTETLVVKNYVSLLKRLAKLQICLSILEMISSNTKFFETIGCIRVTVIDQIGLSLEGFDLNIYACHIKFNKW